MLMASACRLADRRALLAGFDGFRRRVDRTPPRRD